MLNKTIRSTIIVTVQAILPVVLLLLLAPQLLQFNSDLNKANHFLLIHKTGFLIAHLTLCIALIYLWPAIIRRYIKRHTHEINSEQVQSALNIKWYLLGAMAFFELL
ncbi:MAG: hypothetical protein PSV35_03680, partial [bacterium]|nr:hypothetical protein [bacterium]